LRLTPLRVVDSMGGLLLGVMIGLAIVWVCAAAVRNSTHASNPTAFRRDLQRSWIVRRLDAALPTRSLDHLLTTFAGPSVPTLPPSVGVLRNHAIGASLTRVVKVLGTACGEGVEGSGWFARRDLVVTAAHVVAGERNTLVEIPGDAEQHVATVVVFDAHNDVAVLRISGATAIPLRMADPQNGASVAIVGYPLDGSLSAIAGRVGSTANEFTQDALGRGPVLRAITAIAGRVHKGDSGGPVIDTHGKVQAMIFAKKKDSRSGYAVPTSIVRSDLAKAGRRAVSTEACAP
jgi:S1-C subfamily serine protease